MYQHSSTCMIGKNTRRAGRRIGAQTNTPREQAPRVDDIRHDLVARIRAEIEAGTYDTPEKFELAFERMIDDVE